MSTSECRDLTDVKRPDGANQHGHAGHCGNQRKEAALQVLMNTLTHTAEHEVPLPGETTTEGGLNITVDRKH